jgi:5,10-methylenetetrahydrofolate reductase
MLAKMELGCRFLVTQAVYDVASTKALLSDYALALAERGWAPIPVIVRRLIATT